jgi:hypothetical protein
LVAKDIRARYALVPDVVDNSRDHLRLSFHGNTNIANVGSQPASSITPTTSTQAGSIVPAEKQTPSPPDNAPTTSGDKTVDVSTPSPPDDTLPTSGEKTLDVSTSLPLTSRPLSLDQNQSETIPAGAMPAVVARTPENPLHVDKDAPAWVNDAARHLVEVDLGSNWVACVNSWLDAEKLVGYGVGDKKVFPPLAVASRDLLF